MSIFVFFLLYAHKHTHTCLFNFAMLFGGVCLFFSSLNFAVASRRCYRCGDSDMIFQMAFLQYLCFQVLFTSFPVCVFFFLPSVWYLFFCVCTRVFVLVCVYVWMGSTFSCSFTCCVSISLEILCIRNLLFASVSMRKFYNRNKYSTRLKTTI